MSLIEIRGLTHRFPDGTTALSAVDLDIDHGEFVVLAGRNGSGKTVLVRHINGLLLPTSGTVCVGGVSVSKNLMAARLRVGMIFQDADSQIVAESVSEEVAFGPRNLRWAPSEVEHRVEAVLERVGLSALSEREPHTLSGGEKRRLAIAGVLVMDPEILVLDEPLATLDYPGVKEVLEALLSLHAEGRTIVLITHDLSRVVSHANRLVVMDHGSVVLDGPPDRIGPLVEEYGVRKPTVGDNHSWLV